MHKTDYLGQVGDSRQVEVPDLGPKDWHDCLSACYLMDEAEPDCVDVGLSEREADNRVSGDLSTVYASGSRNVVKPQLLNVDCQRSG